MYLPFTRPGLYRCLRKKGEMGNSLLIKGNLLCLRKNGGISKIYIKETRLRISAKGLARFTVPRSALCVFGSYRAILVVINLLSSTSKSLGRVGWGTEKKTDRVGTGPETMQVRNSNHVFPSFFTPLLLYPSGGPVCSPQGDSNMIS